MTTKREEALYHALSLHPTSAAQLIHEARQIEEYLAAAPQTTDAVNTSALGEVVHGTVPGRMAAPLANLNYGEALAALKAGARVARDGWNGKGMYLTLHKGSAPVDKFGRAEVAGMPIDLFDIGDLGTVTRLPSIAMKTATGATLIGWLASQTDLLAEDWRIVE